MRAGLPQDPVTVLEASAVTGFAVLARDLPESLRDSIGSAILRA